MPPPPSGGGGLSGTVSLGQTIQGGTVRGSWVIALYYDYDPSQDAFDQSRSKGVQIGQDGRQAPFNLSGLVAGQYVLVGVKDMDGNGEVSSPDYLGIYQDSQGNFLVTPGRSGLSLVMELASADGYHGYAQQGTLVGLPAGALRTLRVPTRR
jgi:serine protease